MLNNDIHRRIVEKFGDLFEIWGAVDNAKLLTFCSATISESGFINVEEATFRLVTNDWIPIDSKWELDLLNELVSNRKRFTKGLRYNLTKSRPMATAITNELNSATAMYIIPLGSSDEYRRCLSELIENSSFKSWVWDVAKESMPNLN